MSSFVKTSHLWIQNILAVLLPLTLVFFLPVTKDFYDTGKWILIVGIALCSVILWSFQTVLSKTIRITMPAIALGLLGMVATGLIGLVVVSGNKVEALTNPLGLGTFTALLIISVFSSSLITSQKQRRLIRTATEVIAGLLALATIYQHIGIQTLLFPNSATLHDPLWTPVGSSWGLVTVFLLLLPWIIQSAWNAWGCKEEVKTALYTIGTGLVIVAIGLTLWRFIPTLPATSLPWSVGAVIAGKTIGTNLKQAVFGIGAENYISAFSAFRPVTLNLTPLWNKAFSSSATVLFHIITTMGLLGFLAFTGLLITFWLSVKTSKTGKIRMGIVLLLALLFPPTLVFFLCLTIIAFQHHTPAFKQEVTPAGGIFFTFIPVTLTFIALFYLTGWYQGELFFFQSIQAYQKGNISKTYQSIQKAINANPNSAYYHMAAATTSLSIANQLLATAQEQATQTNPLSEEDKQTVTALIDQSIRHSKEAVLLSPASVLTWSEMALTYQQLVGVATSADTWAIATYQKAILLDPTNPILRTNLGILYTQLKRFDEAKSAFDAALTLKPNYANASFNLAHMYKEKGDKEMALTVLNQTLNMLPENSDEQIKVFEEMKAVKGE